jgi:hypothetical protein
MLSYFAARGDFQQLRPLGYFGLKDLQKRLAAYPNGVIRCRSAT